MRFSTGARPTEAQWVAALQRGDATAQRQVYDQYAGRMLATCLRYVGDQPEAEDLMIGGFLKVFDKIGQFRGEGSFEGWVRRVMVNDCLAHLRRHRSVLYVETGIEEADYAPDCQPPADHLEAEDLRRLIQRLPIGYQTVFNLYAIEWYAHQEIAQLLGITEGTSKSQLSRARSLLQQYLKASELTSTTYDNG